MKLLLTGATGFVGRNVLLRWLADERVERVAVCVRHGGKLHAWLASEGVRGVPEKLEVVQGDHRDWGLKALGFVPDGAVHAAAVLFGRSEADYRECNVEGTRRLMESLPEGCRVVVLSSQSAAGPAPESGGAVDESSPCRPLSGYGKSKLEMERMLAAEWAGRREVLVLRPPMVLGPRDAATVPLLKMARQRVWLVPGSRPKELSWVGVSDLVRAVEAVLCAGSWSGGAGGGLPVYFVCSGGVVSDEELVRAAGQAVGRRAPVVRLPDAVLRVAVLASRMIPGIGEAVPSLQPDRAAELFVRRWVVDGSRFCRDFGWEPKAVLAEELERAARWLAERGVL